MSVLTGMNLKALPFEKVELFFCISKTPRLTRGSMNAMHLHIIIPSLTM